VLKTCADLNTVTGVVQMETATSACNSGQTHWTYYWKLCTTFRTIFCGAVKCDLCLFVVKGHRPL